MATRTPTRTTFNLQGVVGSLTTRLDTELPARGWSILFTGTNVRVYKMATGGTDCVLFVDDTGSGAGGAREAIVRAAEGASGIATPIDSFPTTVQVSNANCVWRKSDTADATNRACTLVGDGRYFALQCNHSGSAGGDLYRFGDFERDTSFDTFNCLISTRNSANSGSQGLCFSATKAVGDAATPASRVFFMRTPDGLTKSEYGGMRAAAANYGHIPSSLIATYPNAKFNNKLQVGFTDLISTGSAASNTPLAGAGVRGCEPFVMELIIGTGVTGLTHGDDFVDSAYDPAATMWMYSIGANMTSGVTRYALQGAGTWDCGL